MSEQHSDTGAEPTADEFDAVAAFERHLSARDADTGEGADDAADAEATDDEEGAEAQADRSDDAEDEEDADEADDDSDADEAAGEEQEADKPLDLDNTKVTVTVDGKTEELPLAEVVKGYQRQADFTRKTQALAEDRRTFASERDAVKAERDQYGELLGALQTKLGQLADLEKEPDWEALYQADPLAYVRQREAFREREEHSRAVRAEQQRIKAERAKEADAAFSARVREQWEAAVEARPEWRDEKTWNRDIAAIKRDAEDRGFTVEEINAACSTDARVLQALADAAAYRKLMSNKPKPERAPASAPAAKAPTHASKPRPVTEVTRMKQRLAKTGSVQDAAALFQKLL